MIINKKIATSFTSLIFIVIASTGALMFFHLYDEYTKSLHELIGLFFVLFALLHVFFNFKAMKNYFKLKTFFLSGIIVLIFSISIIISSLNEEGGKGDIFTTLFESDNKKVFVLFADSYEKAKAKLEKDGIKIANTKNIEEIAEKNDMDPFMVLESLSN